MIELELSKYEEGYFEGHICAIEIIKGNIEDQIIKGYDIRIMRDSILNWCELSLKANRLMIDDSREMVNKKRFEK